MRGLSLPRSVLAGAVALAFGMTGLMVAPSEAHAQGREDNGVEKCYWIEDQASGLLGPDALRELYGSFGGCVVRNSSHTSPGAEAAHYCRELVDRRFFPTHGACVQVLKEVLKD